MQKTKEAPVHTDAEEEVVDAKTGPMESLLEATGKRPANDDVVEGPVIAIGRARVFVDLFPFGTGIIYGREYLSARESLKNTICRSSEVQRLAAAADRKARRVSPVAAIADLLAASFAGLPIITIAVLLVHEGIETLCGEGWRSSSKAGNSSPSNTD